MKPDALCVALRRELESALSLLPHDALYPNGVNQVLQPFGSNAPQVRKRIEEALKALSTFEDTTRIEVRKGDRVSADRWGACKGRTHTVEHIDADTRYALLKAEQTGSLNLVPLIEVVRILP